MNVVKDIAVGIPVCGNGESEDRNPKTPFKYKSL